jgi:antitoxin component YwqK of YwqJK toxin-antitoxin module
MKAGELHGTWEWFRRDGSLMRSGEFRAGHQCGVWRTYSSDGRLVTEKIVK